MNDKNVFVLLVGSLLVLAYVQSLLRFHDTAHLVMSLLFAVAIYDSANRFHDGHRVSFRHPVSALAGLGLGLLIILNFKYTHFYLMRLTPFLGGLAFITFSFSIRGIKQYWRELLLLFLLGVPSVVVIYLPDPSPLAAHFGTWILNILGFESSVQGREILTAASRVSVFRGCSGLEYMTYLLGLAGLAMVLFPTHGAGRYHVPCIGIAIGFVTNGFRVALLTLLTIQGDSDGFVYWHEGQGSLLFGGGAVLAFSLYYWLLLRFDWRLPKRVRA
jgi:cyanoexosortase A